MSFDYNTLVIDRTSSDVTARNYKGTYNFTDLNRVENCCIDLAERLTSFGYTTHLITKTDWKVTDLLTIGELNRIKHNLETLKTNYHTYINTPTTDDTKTTINYNDVNDMEKIMVDLDKIIIDMIDGFLMCGVPVANGGYVWNQRWVKKRVRTTWGEIDNVNAPLSLYSVKGNVEIEELRNDSPIFNSLPLFNQQYNELDTLIGGSN